MRVKRGVRGFTLIEVLIAIVILGLSLAALFQAFSAGFHGLRAAESGVEAVLHARSKMAEVGITIPVEVGEISGEFADGTSWHIEMTPFEGAEGPVTEGLPEVLEVAVSVQKGEGPVLTLRSLRLGLVE